MSILDAKIPIQNVQVEPKKSSYLFKDIKMLSYPEESYKLPLAVIGLIDMNAFFAQCEQLRLGKTLDDPVVCCQWKSLIAVSYAARKYGISRLDPLNLALKKCPHLVVGHAAVFKKGESFWRYMDGLPSQALHKVSLDPYRRELRKIFRILQSQCDLVEKASVDECYLDLGRLVFAKLMSLFPELLDLQDSDSLPPIPSHLPEELYCKGLFYQSDEEKSASLDNHTVPLGNLPHIMQLSSIVVSDWDDICHLVGSHILFAIRGKVYEELKYTTSGGLASTKTVAKLAAGFVKPDNQTIIRPKSIPSFLANFELTDITSMGGIIGKDILHQLQVPPGANSTSYIRKELTLDQLKEEFPKDHPLAVRIFELCRGTFQQMLKLRTDVKSMMSRKNFLPQYPVNSVGDIFDWIKVFVGDLYGRLVELDDESMNLSLLQQNPGDNASISRPRTVAVHFTTSSWEKLSKQMKFPVIRDLVKFRATLESAYFKLLCQILENNKPSDSLVKFTELSPEDPHLYQISTPLLANLSVVIGNFIKTSNASLIDSYGINTGPNDLKSEFQRVASEGAINQKVGTSLLKAPVVKRSNSYVKQLFDDFEKEQKSQKNSDTLISTTRLRKASFKEDKEYVAKMFKDFQDDVLVHKAIASLGMKEEAFDENKKKVKREIVVSASPEKVSLSEEELLKSLKQLQRCTQCNITVEDIFEHRDYHVALDLSSRLNGDQGSTASTAATLRKKRKGAQTQTTLPF